MSEKDADDMEAAIGEPTTTVKMPARVRKQTEESLQYRREMVEKTVKRCKAQFTKQLKVLEQLMDGSTSREILIREEENLDNE